MIGPSSTEDQLSPSSSPTALVGWIPETAGRGTLSLIITCLITTFLCTWVVIHARVSGERLLFHRLHKGFLFLKGIVAPEFIAVESLQEWNQARNLVQKCGQATNGRLKLIQAYYIGMLAIRYRVDPHDSQENRVLWPNQFAWLLDQGLINWDVHHTLWSLTEESICDKSKADGATKLIALFQVCWFMAQCIMRHVHELPLSQLESMTLSYIPLFMITYIFWWLKPKDILAPTLVDLPNMLPEQQATFDLMAVSHEFDHADGRTKAPLSSLCSLTPRVFEKEAEDQALQRAHGHTIRGCGRHAIERPNTSGSEITVVSEGSHAEKYPSLPKETVVAHWDPELYRSRILWPVTCLFGASFGALHLISWNSEFPTLVEQWIWRGAGIASIVSMLVFMQFERVVLRWGGPLTMISILSPVVYLMSRVVMMGLVFAAFRASDPAIYSTYVVSNYWFHVV